MSKQTNVPVITWVDHPLEKDQWIRDLQAKFKPPSSSSHKKVVDIIKNDLQNTFRPSSSSYIERRVDDVYKTLKQLRQDTQCVHAAGRSNEALPG